MYIDINRNELAGIVACVVETRDSAKMQKLTGLSYLDCISLINTLRREV